MSKRLIFCAYAQDENMRSGENVQTVQNKKELYLKNIVVALTSAKTYNPNCDVALVTNTDIPESFAGRLYKNGINIYYEDFDDFVFDSTYTWGLAFYKLCAIEKMLSKAYTSYLLVDTDVYIQSALDDLWEETKDNIMLYDINHRSSIENCKRFNQEVRDFNGETRALVNYGGEFIAADKTLLSAFIKECKSIYEEIKKKDFRTTIGDEFITCLAADKMREKVKNAGGYIYRFWTTTFRLVSTCYRYNAVSVLHMPSEKRRGILKIYDYIQKKGHVPKNKKVYKMLYLEKPNFIDGLKIWVYRWRNEK